MRSQASEDDPQGLSRLPPASPVGQRIANLALVDPFGQSFQLYDALEGRAALIVFLKNIEQCAALTARADELAGLGVELFAIATAQPRDLAEVEMPFAMFCDPDGRITARFENWAFGATQPDDDRAAALAFLLDANQRIAEVRRASPEEISTSAIDRLANRVAAPAETLVSTAPVLVLPRLFDDAFCQALIDLWVEGTPFEGTIGTVGDGDEFNRVYHDKKRRLDLRVSDAGLQRQLELMVGQRIAPELEKAFHFSNFFFEEFIVVCYDAAREDHFSPHRDNLSPGTAERRFALTVNLNDDYDGGGVVFPEFGPDRYRPEAGGVLLFSCSLIHEALPVTKGRRFALLNFARQKEA